MKNLSEKINHGISMPVSSIAQIYQLQMKLSTGDFDLPTISEISRNMGVSRQMIYRWASGESRSRKASRCLSDVIGIILPDKLDGPMITAIRTLFRIR